MKFTIKGSHIVAFLITAVIGIWMLNGTMEIGGQGTAAADKQTIVEREAEKNEKLFRVSFVELQPENREQVISVRGRTKADAIVPVRSETAGIVEKRLVKRGDFVKQGDLVCVIESGARKSDLASAEARLNQTQGEFDANKTLSKKGFATETKMRQMMFNLNAAKAQLEQAKLELARTEIRANASGVVQDPIAEVGDVLSIGAPCVTLVDSDPMYFTGQISERSINNVKNGMAASVELVSGSRISGTVNYIAPAADPQTRTFLIDILLDGKNGNIRDGLTASAEIKLPAMKAFRVSPSWLTLADSGQIGVKTINEANEVVFNPVSILSQTNQGFWIHGLETGVRVITLGQEYVNAGEKIEPVPDKLKKAEVTQ